MVGLSYLLVFTAAIAVTTITTEAKRGAPIMFLPGLFGSKLYVENSREGICKTSGKELTWVGTLLRMYCWETDLMLKYVKGKGYKEIDGVKITMAWEDGTDGIFLDLEGLYDVGYEENESLRAAPYDWRYAADELEKRGYYSFLKEGIEEMYQKYNERIILMTMSMACPVSHYFLTKYSGINQTWKNKHIAKYIPVVGAWSGGEVIALQVAISGAPSQYLDGAPLPRELKNAILDYLSPGLNAFQSLLWFVPNEAIWNDRVLVIGPDGAKYTVNDLEDVLKDDIYVRYKEVKDLSYDKYGEQSAPYVNTYCLYGVGEYTPLRLDYSKCENFSDCKNVTITYINNGDGVVNYEGAQVCVNWGNSNGPYLVESHAFKAKHAAIGYNKEFFETLLKIIGATRTDSGDDEGICHDNGACFLGKSPE